MKKLSIIFFLVLPFALTAQIRSDFTYAFDNSIPLTENGTSYPSPWIGGLNAPQYNTIDLDFDGQDDLVLYDRMAQKVLTFLAKDGMYDYAPQYEANFPEQIYNWLLLRDFNGDGKKDIFTGNIFGISVYENVGQADSNEWRLFPFYDGSSESEVILTKGLSGVINLQLQFDDLPSISDADGDGDLDIFTMNYGGAGVIEFHKNFSVERYGDLNHPEFELVDRWWGGVKECDCGRFAFDRNDCGSSSGRVEHAGGKSLMLMDANGDGVQDMLISEGECSRIYLLINHGTLENPIIDAATEFPSVFPAVIDEYPTAYYEDVTFDGVKDIIIAPNIFSKSSPAIELTETNWLYTNNGTTANPDLEFTTSSFLQNAMLDLGDNAVPAFADFDGDGDLDLFISNNSFPSTVRLYENRGNPFLPDFHLRESDFLGLSSYFFSNMRLRFTDIDGNGTLDFVFTATHMVNGITDVYSIRNTRKGGGMSLSNDPPERLNFALAGPENVSFVDFNRDGRPDILKGRGNGAVELWINRGGTTPSFDLDESDFLGQSPNVNTNNVSFHEADLNSDGKLDLVVCDQSGKLKILSNYRNAKDFSSLETQVVFDHRQQTYYSPNLGGRIWVTTADLYGSGVPLIFAGTSLGGVRVLKNMGYVDPPTVINIYPNPVHINTELLKVSSNKDLQLTIFSAQGQQIRPPLQIPAFTLNQLSLHDIAAGMYILQFKENGKTHTRRLVIR